MALAKSKHRKTYPASAMSSHELLPVAAQRTSHKLPLHRNTNAAPPSLKPASQRTKTAHRARRNDVARRRVAHAHGDALWRRGEHLR